MNRSYDIAVVGSGFAGSLMAMVACRLGHSVVMLEKEKHPRFAIGESSTPLSNLLLEDIAARYNLPRLAPLSKWGTWQEHYPDIGCGLKCGFTFYHHELGHRQPHDFERRRQLLVAASPHDQIADTHWFRADFDEMFVREAQAVGVEYFDEITLNSFVNQDDAVELRGDKDGRAVSIRSRFVIDATGPRGFLHRALHLPEAELPNYPSTQGLFSHFSTVQRLDDLSEYASSKDLPYPIDDAAVHHVFDGGWIWVLRFNNGITSAGVAATHEVASRLRLADGESAWKRLLEFIPALQKQFANAQMERPFVYAKRLSFLSDVICGDKWALLPSAAGFVDPLLSTGFPLALLGISRLAEILKNDWDTPRFRFGLDDYAVQTKEELLATSRLLSGLYANMNNFDVFAALSLLYFAAASYSEAARRLQKPQLAESFLLHNHPVFGPACNKLLEHARHSRTAEESRDLIEDIFCAIEPIDVAGLCNRQRRNWYPVDAEDLFRSAHKVEATHDEVAHLLKSCGFYQ